MGDLGRVGLFGGEFRDRRVSSDVVAEVEQLGYGAIWVPTAPPDLDVVEELARATTAVTIGTGVVSIWAAPAAELAAAFHRVDDVAPGRVLLGLGISHEPLVERSGQHYDRPLSRMDGYLAELTEATPPVPSSSMVIGANGPKMLELAADRTAGAHPYLVTPQHTAMAREVMGDGPLLAPEQKVILEPDAATARALARALLTIYFGLPNYVNNLHRMGFTDGDLEDGGTDELVDALIAWGDADAIAARVHEHLDAGADHVAVHVLDADKIAPPVSTWRELARVLEL